MPLFNSVAKKNCFEVEKLSEGHLHPTLGLRAGHHTQETATYVDPENFLEGSDNKRPPLERIWEPEKVQILSFCSSKLKQNLIGQLSLLASLSVSRW